MIEHAEILLTVRDATGAFAASVPLELSPGGARASLYKANFELPAVAGEPAGAVYKARVLADDVEPSHVRAQLLPLPGTGLLSFYVPGSGAEHWVIVNGRWVALQFD